MHLANIYADPSNDGPKIGTLVVILDRAKNLPNSKSTKQNPYCQARLGKHCSKTKTDKRGGQRPRWDEELRFPVHDSADYYNLKLSVFNDDKKTELIGDAWVELKELVVPGGGQSDFWQEVRCQQKYAGEVRIELTYYDSRPKPAPPLLSSVSISDRRGSSVRESVQGSRQLQQQQKEGSIRRRPLPSNPGSENNTPLDAHKYAASGPRQFGTPPSLGHPPMRRDTEPIVNGSGHYTIDHRRPVRSQISIRSIIDDEHAVQHQINHPTYLHTHHPEAHQQLLGYTENNHDDDYSHDQYALDQSQDQDDRRSHASFHSGTYQQRPVVDEEPPPLVPMHPHLHHSFSAPPALAFGAEQHRHGQDAGYYQQPDALPAPVPAQHWHVEDPFGPDHPESIKRAQLEQQYQQQQQQTNHHQALSIAWMNNDQGQFNGQCENNVIANEGADSEESVPPPPPSHGNMVLYAANSSPGYNYQPQPPAVMHQPMELSPHRRERSTGWEVGRGGNGVYDNGMQLQASRSEASLSLYRDIDHEQKQKQQQQQQQQPQTRQPLCANTDSSSLVPYQGLDQMQADYYGPRSRQYQHSQGQGRNSMIEYSQNDYHADRDGGEVEGNWSPTYNPNSITHRVSPNASPSAMMPAAGNMSTPNRRHPLAQQHLITSSPPEMPSPYEGMPVIKPLAISLNKSRFGAPASNKESPSGWASQTRNSIPRKSVSPSVSMTKNNFNVGFNTPFGPDSYDSLNPTVAASKAKGDEVIVDFHGNIVDPSDRLPESSWAPEPQVRVKETTRSSTWRSESEFNNGRPSGSRDIGQKGRLSRGSGTASTAELKENYHMGSSPRPSPLVAGRANVYPSSPLNSSPIESSRYVGNRLTKRGHQSNNRSQGSLGALGGNISSWDQPIRDVPPTPTARMIGPPPIPPKIPVDSLERGSPNSRVYFTNDARNELNGGMQGMNLESPSGSLPPPTPNGKKNGGRRLLGFGG